jgi:ankyrin repeat protein
MSRRFSLTPVWTLALVVAVVSAVGCGSKGGDMTPVHKATQSGDQAALESAVAGGANVDAVEGDNGYTALHIAALNNNGKAAKFLVDHNANVNARDDDQATPLHLASNRNSKDVIVVLLAAKADVNAVDEDGETALYLASEAGDVDTVKMLLDAGADVNIRNEDGETALVVARRKNQQPVAQLIEQRSGAPAAKP